MVETGTLNRRLYEQMCWVDGRCALRRSLTRLSGDIASLLTDEITNGFPNSSRADTKENL